MSKLQIALLELLIVGGLGVILVVVGLIIHIVSKKHHKMCTKKTEGRVVQHAFSGKSRMHPIVEYEVDGISYKTQKKFCGIKKVKVNHIQSQAYEDEKGWLYVKSGNMINLHELARQLWPIDSKMTVYYNPNNPKMNYVERTITNTFTSMMFIIMGVVTLWLVLLVAFFDSALTYT